MSLIVPPDAECAIAVIQNMQQCLPLSAQLVGTTKALLLSTGLSSHYVVVHPALYLEKTSSSRDPVSVLLWTILSLHMSALSGRSDLGSQVI